MSSFHHSRARRRAIALLLVALTVGCTSWQTAQVTPQALLETEKPKSVRVTTHDTRQMVRGPRIASARFVPPLPPGRGGQGVWA